MRRGAALQYGRFLCPTVGEGGREGRRFLFGSGAADTSGGLFVFMLVRQPLLLFLCYFFYTVVSKPRDDRSKTRCVVEV